MNTIHLVLFASTLAIISSITGISTYTSIVNSQTPTTTSDLPATFGNESASNMGSTNNTVPLHNTTTTYAAPPL